MVRELAEKVLNGERISKAEALLLYDQPLDELSEYANIIRRKYCDNSFDICTIINAKSGNCSEDCKFCAQSAYSMTDTEYYPLMSADEIVERAREDYRQGILRFSIVTSGKKLSDAEVDLMCDTVKRISNEVGVSVCVSFGLLDEMQFRKLKEAGADRVHNNLESSENNFPNVCTTHSFQDKVTAIRTAQAAGLSVCSGGIMGLGESVEDRIDMAIALRELDIKSVPVNMLNAIQGTPFIDNERISDEELQRIVAVYRFILPDAAIRLAGGRGLLRDKGEACFRSGANAAISGDMLTTAGITVKTDMEMIEKLEYKPGLCKD